MADHMDLIAGYYAAKERKLVVVFKLQNHPHLVLSASMGPVCSKHTSLGLWFWFQIGFTILNKCIVSYKCGHGNYSNHNCKCLLYCLNERINT